MSDTSPQRFSYESMGTTWSVSLWDEVSEADFIRLQNRIKDDSAVFDNLYSRFNKQSLVWSLTEMRGVVTVPRDLVEMLRLYERLHDLSGGRFSPLIGFTLSDMGYDEQYSLKPKAHIRPVPRFHEALHIVDDEHIELKESVLIDLGALGKGYFVDRIAVVLREHGYKRFLVDGSGDVVHQGSGARLRVGLEHPGDTSKVIGVVEMGDGAMCSSAGNRRKWGHYHHTINPLTLTSPEDVLATWVMADSAAVADGLATCFFLDDPEKYRKDFSFEYCLLNKEFRVRRSPGFVAELF
jgi:thiamine biosynthesis lipoprotein